MTATAAEDVAATLLWISFSTSGVNMMDNMDQVPDAPVEMPKTNISCIKNKMKRQELYRKMKLEQKKVDRAKYLFFLILSPNT